MIGPETDLKASESDLDSGDDVTLTCEVGDFDDAER